MADNKKKIIGIINARGGSKGIPRKNIKLLNGKPLIAYSIEQGLKSKLLDRLIVSTEDEEIAEIANKYGAVVPFLRPKELAKDNVRQIWSIFHAIDHFKEKNEVFDIVVLLQPTSPFRTAQDIDQCINLLKQNTANSVVSFSSVMGGHPYHMFTIEGQSPKRLINTQKLNMQRQHLPETYIVNGAVKIAYTNWLRKEKTFISDNMKGYIMPIERSINIDTKFDWLLAEFISSRTKGEMNDS